MFHRFRRFLTTTHATPPASDVPHDQRCWPCRLQNTPCSLESGPTNGVCLVCHTFNMKCVGVGEDFPMTSNSKRAANAIRQWIAHPVNRDSNVPPLDLSRLVPLVFTVEPVAVQEALERHANPPKTLTNSFNLAMQIASQAQDLGKSGPPLTSIANHAFATCRLLLLRVPPDGALFPSHPIERDHRNVSVLTAALPVLSTILRQTSELLLRGPLNDASATGQALEIILACITQLEQSLEEARGAADVGHIVEDIKSILGIKKTTTLHDLDVVGAGERLGPRSDRGGTPWSSTFSLAPDTRGNEATRRNSVWSLPSTSSDLTGTGPRVLGGDLHSEHRLTPPRTASQPPPSRYNIKHPMPSRKHFSPRRRNDQSPSLPSNDPSPNKLSTSMLQRTLAEPPVAPQPVYPHYPKKTARLPLDVALAVASILEDIPAVPLELIIPLTQVLDVISGIWDAVKAMRDGKDRWVDLLFRVLRFVHSLVDRLKGRNIPDSTPTASSLFTLKSNLMAISADATRWSRLRLVTRYIRRDKVMTAISMHGDNVTDCLHTFQIVTSIGAFDPAERVETIVSPGPSVSARLLVASESTPVSISAAGLHAFFERPAGQAVFEQIGAAVQRCFEELGLRATAAPPGSRSPGMTILRTGHDRHVSYLTTQISELTAEVGRILPDILVVTDMKIPFVGWRTRWPQTGNSTRQLRETVSATLQLLDELHGPRRTNVIQPCYRERCTTWCGT
ncbi:hypothetical protein BS47DRAFT_735403 [Hydnum rufescens UP504]|uniref:Uncharacterized protein n=1 Tax=Hydnum rufescens UP504 TaxID=1448309 RepID=A0A9P6DMV1_9AGAM|nr:hypothetical protein BS47DRAFT_735403 [Hydnum rufescens UP504]